MKKISHSVILLLLLNIANAQISLQDSLVSYYPFNGDAQDISGNGNHGNVYGASLTTDRFGNPNSAYSFNGLDNYIETTNNMLPSQTSSYSITCWFKLSNFTHHGVIVSDRNGFNYNYALWVNNACMSNSLYNGIKFSDVRTCNLDTLWTNITTTYNHKKKQALFLFKW